MSIEGLGLWGCTRSGLLDIWNNERTFQYMANCGQPKFATCSQPLKSFVTAGLDPNSYVNQTYTTPSANNAWWYDSRRPESDAFFGLEVIRVTGLHESTVETTATVIPQSGCSATLMYDDPVDKGYEILVEGILHGATCCAVRYGYLALKKALRCCGAPGCTGTTLKYIPCVPTTALTVPMNTCGLTPEDASPISPWRFVKNAKILDEPHITAGIPDGQSCGCGCAPDTWVSFVIRAEGGQFTDSTNLINAQPIVGTDHCITDISLCNCNPIDPLADAGCPTPLMPSPPNAVSACFCPIFSTDRRCYEFQIPSSLFDVQLEFTVTTGTGVPLKNFKVQYWKKVGSSLIGSGLYDKCNINGGFGLIPLPAGTTWTSTYGGVYVTPPTGGTIRGNRTLLSSTGLPSNPCARTSCGVYIMCVYTDPLYTAADATISVSYRYVEP